MSPTLGLLSYFALLVALGAGACARPPVAVAAVVCLFALKQWGQTAHPWLAQYPVLTNYAVAAIVAVAVMLRGVRGGCLFCRIPTLHWLVITLYAYAAVSLLWTPDPSAAFGNWEHDYPYVVVAVLLAPLLIKDADDLQTALHWLVLVGGALLALLLFFGTWGQRGLVLGSGVFDYETNPLALAGVGGAVACAAMFVQPRRLRSFAWLLRLVVVALALVVIIRSGSRGQIIAVLLAVTLMLPIGYSFARVRGVAAIAVGLAALGAAAAYGVAQYIDLFDARFSESSALSDAQGRLVMVRALLDAWSRGGVGILTGLGNSAAFDPRIAGFYPHNVPLEILGEEGLIGFALYLAILVQSAGALIKARAAAGTDPVRGGVVAAAGSSFAFFFLISLKEGNMIGSVYFFMYSILLGSLSTVFASSVRRDAALRTAPLVPRVAFPNVMR